MEGMSGVNFLEAAICVIDNIVRMWRGAIPASAYRLGIGITFKQPVIILCVSFSHINMPSMSNGPTKDRSIIMLKTEAPMWLFVRLLDGLPIWSLLISAEDYLWCLHLLWCLERVLETECAIQCDSEVNRVWINGQAPNHSI